MIDGDAHRALFKFRSIIVAVLSPTLYRAVQHGTPGSAAHFALTWCLLLRHRLHYNISISQGCKLPVFVSHMFHYLFPVRRANRTCQFQHRQRDRRHGGEQQSGNGGDQRRRRQSGPHQRQQRRRRRRCPGKGGRAVVGSRDPAARVRAADSAAGQRSVRRPLRRRCRRRHASWDLASPAPGTGFEAPRANQTPSQLKG